MRLTGAEIIWESLQKEGCDLVFGYPGGAILPTYDALSKYPQVHHVLTRHEQGATHMADGYARATGKVGVVMATQRAGRDQPGDRHRHRDHGLLADRRHHRAGADRRDRQRRLPGDRRHRHHAADHQAQLPGGRRARPGGDAARGVPHRAHRPARPGPGRHPEGRQIAATDFEYPTEPIRLRGYRPLGAASSEQVEAAAELLRDGAPAADPGRPRRRDVGRGATSCASSRRRRRSRSRSPCSARAPSPSTIRCAWA